MKTASARRKSGLFWVGIGLLSVCSVLWLLAIIGILLEPEDAVDVIEGLIILTSIPIGIGIYLIRREMNLRSPEEEFQCMLCGFLNKGDSEFCKNCGAVLNRAREEGLIIAIVVGYILTFLGTWLGIACAVYLLTRKQPRARYHGMLMLIISVVWVIVEAVVANYRHTT